jgi:acyl-CoA thioester hydrolase
MITAEIIVKAQFYDLDPMNVVWHGNYARYLEQARCALLDLIDYNYTQMAASGFAWPVVDMRSKYVGPIRFGQEVVVAATLLEYVNRLKIAYRIRDCVTGAVLHKATTVQVAVRIENGELQLESPPILFDKLRGKV